jgi:hypothetical protein
MGVFRPRRGDNIKIDVSLFARSELVVSALGWKLVVSYCEQGENILCPTIQNDIWDTTWTKE